MANAPIKNILNVGGVDLEKVIARNMGVIRPEYPFEWAGVWDLPSQDYNLKFEKGPSATIKLLLFETSDNSEADISNVAQELVDAFLSTPEKIEHSDSIREQKRCYEYNFGNSQLNQIHYPKKGDNVLILYSEHSPCEFKLTLSDSAGNEQVPIKQHSFTRKREHLKGVSSVSVKMPGQLDKLLFGIWYDRFLAANAKNLYRVKGVIGFKGEEHKSIFQGVHSMFDITTGDNWGSETPVNRIVFIGKDLNEIDIRSSLKYCLASH